MDDEEALIGTFRATLAELYAFVARRAGGERALAEDVVQETWLRALAAWRRRGAPHEPLAWLKTTARRLLLNHFRARCRRPGDADMAALDATAAPTLRDAIGRSPEAAALLHRGIARLRDDQAALVEAFHLDGRSTRELAAERGVSERAVEGRLHRARAALRRHLAPLCADDVLLERWLPVTESPR